ncbi:MAG: hypothetical protein K2L15_04115 [Eubacteriales bacterium]|nr:hypothetical protein [Eubacteriales bacterium]
MFSCKIVREVTTGNVYKTIFPNAIKYFSISNNPMAISKTTNEKHTGSYQISIKTLDRKEYHLTKESFNYNAVYTLYELLEAKIGLRKLKDRHIQIIEKLDEENKAFFKDVQNQNVMIHSQKLQNTLEKIEEILRK